MSRLRRGYDLLRRGELRELSIRSLKSMIASLRKHVAGHVRYEDSPYYGRITRSPSVELDETGPKQPRLNVVVPQLDREASYGGIRSAMELASELSRHYDRIRFISLGTLRAAHLFDLNDYVANPSRKSIEVASLRDSAEVICGANEIFLCTYWKTVALWEAYSQALTRAGLQSNPFYYFIQDYEPGFFPFGYEYASILKTYSYPAFTHAIFNSQELRDFFKLLSLAFAEEYVIRPSLDRAIFDYLEHNSHKLKPKDKTRIQILMYGRPKPRNCFEPIIDGLHRFFREMSPHERKRYSIVSAGASHDDILLSPDVLIRSLGKLSMERYIEELEKSHIGISLMVSPHLSYPPLEMATFGLYTITNKFFNKDLSACHPLIHSLDYPLPDELANELGKALDYVQRTSRDEMIARVPSNMCLSSWRENIGAIGIEPISSNNMRLLQSVEGRVSSKL